LSADCGDLVLTEAEIQVDYSMAFRTRQMMMMPLAPAQTEVVRAIGKIDPLESLHPQQLLNGSINGGAPDPWVGPVQFPHQILCGEG
jgi:hypothetical protein